MPLLRAWEILTIGYLVVYNTINFFLLAIAFIRVRFFLQMKNLLNLDEFYKSPNVPGVSLLVPAFNEQETIAENIRSLTKLKYPRYEIIIVNDGSSDRTLEELLASYPLNRQDVGYEQKIETAPIRGFYQAVFTDADKTLRLVLIDKENGGKADALNAALNAARFPYICSMDADSIVDEEAILQIMQVMVARDDVIACGGQIALTNGCTIEGGRVTQVDLPKNALAMFQVVEYMRSFTAGRTAWSQLHGLLILSGVFAIFRRQDLLEVEGFLTDRLNSKIVLEYCPQKNTVCEDMEIVVRIHRYLLEKGKSARVLFLPYPITWSQAPENIADFGKQRNRWYRGLAQTLWYHRVMLFNPKYKQIGLLSMPYQFLFEFLGPLLEAAGYLALPLLYWAGLLRADYLTQFFLVAVLYGSLLSVCAVLLGFWSETYIGDRRKHSTLFRYRRSGSLGKLVVYAVLSMFGYKQLQLVFALQGFINFLQGKQTWGKFHHERHAT